jgi:NAD(P)-dependent dehydrogenase (short-subunit alcohol dehydrogenase family)
VAGEFYVNAINVMRGAEALSTYQPISDREKFRIEYWALEEAKLQRMPPEKEFSRKVAVVVGAGSGIGREVVLQLARKGAHVVATDMNLAGAEAVAKEAAALSNGEMAIAAELNLTSRESIRAALRKTVQQFGGFDILINTAAIYPTPDPSTPAEAVWGQALSVNVTSNHVLAQEAATILKAQGLPASIVLTSSANAVVPKHGSEPYDVSKAAINHLIRELAIGLGPEIRVNGIAPATVVAGSAMFPRDRVMVLLKKYSIAFDEPEFTEDLRSKLAEFYAKRTITHRRFCRSTTPTRSAGSRGIRAPRPRTTSFPWTAGWPTRSCDADGRPQALNSKAAGATAISSEPASTLMSTLPADPFGAVASIVVASTTFASGASVSPNETVMVPANLSPLIVTG